MEQNRAMQIMEEGFVWSEAVLLAMCQEFEIEAVEHLIFAITEFQEMKMQPYLERALKKKEIMET